MRIIDLRSDTVTLPTQAMREAMMRAEVGDDDRGDDPTVKRLEAMAAERTGKEAALFVASGTMANLVSVLTHCQRGQEIIVGSKAHIFTSEVGGVSALGGVIIRQVPNDSRGMMDPEEVEMAIRTQDPHYPPTGLVCLENTHNRCGGAVLTSEDIASIAAVAHKHNIPVHLDGARIFNASVYLGIPVRELTKEVDSVSFCLSKGLSAPVGSLICGTRDFIARARKYRKMVGGGMRQAGVIAAAGIVALETMVARLAEDHANARILARGLASIPALSIDPESVQTNIVIVELKRGTSSEWRDRLAKSGVLVTTPDRKRLRFVTHYGIGERDVKEALEMVGKVMEKA